MTLGHIDNKSKYGTTNIGQSNINNQGGSANIKLASSMNSGDHSNVNIGLLELLVNNQKGHRDMTLGEVDNSSKYGITKIGQSNINNQGGSANISLKKSINSGDHSEVDIGLLELLVNNQKGHRDMTLGEVDNTSKFGTTNIGQSNINNQGGSANISLKKSVNSGDHSMVNIGLQN